MRPIRWTFDSLRSRIVSRIADSETAAADMGTKAANDALADAGVSPEDIDLVIAATATPDAVTGRFDQFVQAYNQALQVALQSNERQGHWWPSLESLGRRLATRHHSR